MEISKERQKQPLTLFEQQSRKSTIIGLLGILACRRQATVAKEDLIIYASDLEAFELCDVDTAFESVGRTTRKAGETAFPDIGTLIDAVKLSRDARRRLSSNYGEFQCEVCGNTSPRMSDGIAWCVPCRASHNAKREADRAA